MILLCMRYRLSADTRVREFPDKWRNNRDGNWQVPKFEDGEIPFGYLAILDTSSEQIPAFRFFWHMGAWKIGVESKVSPFRNVVTDTIQQRSNTSSGGYNSVDLRTNQKLVSLVMMIPPELTRAFCIV